MNTNTPRLSDKRISYFFHHARNACEFSDHERARLGSVLVYKNRIVAMGHNYQHKTSPLQKRLNRLRGFDPNATYCVNSIHAEVACINNAKGLDIDYSKASIFVYRILKDGSRALAKPCPACMGLIREMGIKNIYYTTFEGWEHLEIGGKLK